MGEDTLSGSDFNHRFAGLDMGQLDDVLSDVEIDQEILPEWPLPHFMESVDCDNRAAQENLSVAELRQRRVPQ